MPKKFAEDTKYYLELGKRDCARCGLPVDLSNLHPNSLEIPTDGTHWTIVHGSEDLCGDDQRGWVIES